MHFAIQKEVLVQCLREVSNALPGRSVQPILSHIYIQSVDEATVLFKATDLDLFIESKANAVVYTPGAISLPGKKLIEVVSKLADDLVSFQTNKETLETSIQCCKAKISLAGLDADDFPTLGNVASEGLLMPADIVRKAIAQTSFAAASFDTGSVISGVYLSINDGEFECVATDGNRLAYKHELLSINSPGKKTSSVAKSESSMAVSSGAGKGSAGVRDKSTIATAATATLEKSLSFKAIIPARASNGVVMIIDSQISRAKRNGEAGDNVSAARDVRLSMSNGIISFKTESNLLSTRIISGEYPAFKELFPSQCKYLATFETDALITALDRVAVMADERKHLIRLHFEGEVMQITANTPDFGRAQDEVPMKFEGQVLDVAVNVRYLLDVLRCINSAEVQIEMTAPLQPLIVKELDSDSYKYLLMPVQLKTGE
jgi:DNA polymerase-3 subunit beta